LKCYDHKLKQFVALKILVNTPQMRVQGRAEVSFHSSLNHADSEGCSCVARMLDTFDFRGHICAVFEVLGQNLYEYVRRSGFRSLPVLDVRRVGREVLEAVAFTHANGIVHCDLKPENVLIVPNSAPLSVRVIDYGSACRIGQPHFSYIQSRFYRAPEVILGIPYGPPMDVWSFGCLIAELVAGQPLFPGETEAEALRLQMELLGTPPKEVIAGAARREKFFDAGGCPIEPPANRRTLGSTTRTSDPELLELLLRCLEWDQERRITAEEALRHPFFAGADKGDRQGKGSRPVRRKARDPSGGIGSPALVSWILEGRPVQAPKRKSAPV
jgi:dual specificity tyrosine-phosphorylation-regulated kinase 2/3/4